MESVWQSERALAVLFLRIVLFQGKQILHPFADDMTAETALIIILSVDIDVCLALLVLFSAITVKSHCCDRQYSRKQRIFFYLLLASLGDSSAFLLFQASGMDHHPNNGLLYVFWGLLQLDDIIFCWAALYVSFEVFTTLRRIDFRCLKVRFPTVVEEVCILIVVIIISAGFTALGHFALHDPSWFIVMYLPLVFLWFIDIASVVLVLVQLCVAYRRVEDGQVANRLRRPAALTVTLLVFLVFYVIGVCVVPRIALSDRDRDNTVALGSVYILCSKVVSYMFVVIFGWKMLQDLGRQCCCRRYRRHRARGYGKIPGQEERGVLSLQTGVPSTTRTYYTCDDMGSTTWTYQTCDESEAPEWFQAVPTPHPPVQ